MRPSLLTHVSVPKPPALALLQELLPAMKLVKYYAWERFFEDQVC
jgi:hypothetical protein